MATTTGSNGTARKMPRMRSIMRYSRILDSTRRYLTDDPTPAKLAAYIKQADDGDIATMIELNEEMEGKDAHLQSVASRRRESVTALDWEVIPDTRTDDTKGAKAAADYCHGILTALRSWPDTLEHLQTAIGPGVAVTESVWNKGQLVDTIDVSGHRLMIDPWVDNKIRIETDQEQVDGVAIYSPGFILFTPNARAGFPIRVTITRAQARLWLLKHFAMADWAAFTEQFGMPWRVAKFPPGMKDSDVSDLEALLQDLAADGYAVLPEGVELELLEAARNNQPYEGMIDLLERKQSILYLGQTLTTEQGNVGSLALGQVHDNVRASITLSDIKNEARTIRDQLLTWMVRFRFPGKSLPIPHFNRITAEVENIELQRLKLDQLRLANEMSLKVDKEVKYEMLNIPLPQQTEDDT